MTTIPECRYVCGDLYLMVKGAALDFFPSPSSPPDPPLPTTSMVMWFHAILWSPDNRKLGILLQGSDVIHTQNRLPFCRSSCNVAENIAIVMFIYMYVHLPLHGSDVIQTQNLLPFCLSSCNGNIYIHVCAFTTAGLRRDPNTEPIALLSVLL